MDFRVFISISLRTYQKEIDPLHSHLVMSSPANLLLADLASSGVKQIPTSYIRPISDRPNLSDVQISDVPIPLIDLHGLNGPNHSLIIKQISQACENDGFFQVPAKTVFIFLCYSLLTSLLPSLSSPRFVHILAVVMLQNYGC